MSLFRSVRKSCLVILMALCTGSAQSPQPATDKTSQWMIDMERRWAEASCTGQVVVDELLAEDFIGTAPDGKRYTKADAVQSAKKRTTRERDCKLLGAKVYYYGDSIAIVQGSESAVLPKDGATQVLIWNDTWMKRNGKWQIISVQDMKGSAK